MGEKGSFSCTKARLAPQELGRVHLFSSSLRGTSHKISGASVSQRPNSVHWSWCRTHPPQGKWGLISGGNELCLVGQQIRSKSPLRVPTKEMIEEESEKRPLRRKTFSAETNHLTCTPLEALKYHFLHKGAAGIKQPLIWKIRSISCICTMWSQAPVSA